jgi:hypothetical protein
VIAVLRGAVRRPLWLTVLIDALLLSVVVLDVRAAVFWTQVGGSLGTPAALLAGGVALLAALLIVADVRRHLLPHPSVDVEDTEDVDDAA